MLVKSLATSLSSWIGFLERSHMGFVGEEPTLDIALPVIRKVASLLTPCKISADSSFSKSDLGEQDDFCNGGQKLLDDVSKGSLLTREIKIPQKVVQLLPQSYLNSAAAS